MLTLDKTKIFGHLIEKHVNEAAFLWLLRSQAVVQPHHGPTYIRKLEQRINNHLTGLSLNPEAAWEFAVEAANFNESGEVFVLAMLALMSGNNEKINSAIEFASHDKETFKGLVSALGWAPDAYVNVMLRQWIESNDVLHKHLAVVACSVRRMDPQLFLNHLFNDSQHVKNIPLMCRMLRLVGELKRHDLLHELKKAQRHNHKDVVFWAHWSALMLGDQSSLSGLETYVMAPGPFQSRAISVVFRCLAQSQSWEWINKLIKQPGQMANTIIALSVLGDPHGINWLLARMEEPVHAKISGYAFNMITGVDLAEKKLVLTQAPTDDDIEEDEIPVITGYENLPAPDAKKVSEYWQQIRHAFVSGQRYFLGKSINKNNVEQVMNQGAQGQRLAAALEYALLDGTHAYPNLKSALRFTGNK
ncbi:MAG: TIGR02270 family protein [Gammaproteobacteria bacterium]|nr:MAG: TIGR02270 family protein [Gammaproteobacteria bacterium]